MPFPRSGSLASRVRTEAIAAARAADRPEGGGFRPTSKFVNWAWARGCLVLTALLHTIAFPPYNVPEAAFVFAVPVVLYALRQPRWIEFLAVTYAAYVISWLVLIHWLGHVTIGGTIALAAVMALFPTAWCAAARWAMPRAPWSDLLARLAAVAGLAGLWVVQEWVRSWFLTGFPWVTLATSMWQRPVMLQGASIGGAWLVGFTLVFFNLGLASYLQRLGLWVKERRGRFSPEFYLAVLVLFGASFGVAVQERGERQTEAWFRAGFMQPYIPQKEKWDAAEAPKILRIIERETKDLATKNPDLILWPEAVTPIPMFWDQHMNAWVEQLAKETQIPILVGALAFEAEPNTNPEDPKGRWSAGVFLAEPETGLRAEFYRKRHRVPFGEYVPLRRVLPFIQKFVPIGGDIEPGKDPALILVNTPAGAMRVGPLICYEDVFANVARDSVRAGADLLFVATNDAWYGETGSATQHAAHAVVRAVETRRPVVRDGNGGWSGWIDEYGVVQFEAKDAKGSVYFRGNQVADIKRDVRWVGRQSFYVQHGDWFVAVSAALVIGAVLVLRSSRFRFSRES